MHPFLIIWGPKGPAKFEKMSLQDGCRVASKRNLGPAGALTVFQTLDIKSSRFTLPRWEVALMISDLLRIRQFFRLHYDWIDLLQRGNHARGLSFGPSLL